MNASKCNGWGSSPCLQNIGEGRERRLKRRVGQREGIVDAWRHQWCGGTTRIAESENC